MTHQLYEPYNLHYQPFHHHQPSQPNFGDDSGIKTIFVSGLPDDVKAREIHNLFRHRSGFDSCQLKYTGRGNQVVAFVTFFSHQSAVAALHALDGVKFDPQTGSTLHIEFAKSNSWRKRKTGTGYVVIDKRNKVTKDVQDTSSDDGDDGHDNTSNNDTEDDYLPSAKSSETAADPDSSNTKGQSGQLLEGDIPPCSTLFIANLGPNCTEEELKPYFSQYPGFNTLKIRSRGGMPVAFADFEEVEQATNAINSLQGSVLPSSDRGGMHIEYARSKMRKA